jgi:hypothetical protein
MGDKFKKQIIKFIEQDPNVGKNNKGVSLNFNNWIIPTNGKRKFK